MNRNGNGWMRWIALGLGLAIAAAVVFYVTRRQEGYTQAGPDPSRTIVAAAPAARPAPPELIFADESGRGLTLADFAGRVVLVNVWATWCPPCIAEMPSLDALQARLGGERFQVVAIAIDRGGAAVARRWFEANGIAALAVHAANPARFPNWEIPASFLIDAQGRLAWRGKGIFDWEGPEADQVVRELLNE
ncbi:TlpA disulfide reductase family protein [Magnetospirillum sp. UT-4]|uniref:TlpA disulfide reductase family protein n=1 Tax=Magnetospirillum sp. UT-4 TaxID=2681467 RepID=UPI00138317BE|nr:TlpA disulfide reductase family protein [Magnetospirillum sp. UT-4]CAA7624540.1 Thioredoxin family protein [Magnetospirillum sp. UT-4]